MLELFGLKAIGLICLDELRDLLEAVEIELINGLVHVVLDLHPVAVSELSLPVGSDGEDDVAAEEINIVVIVSVSSGQQSGAEAFLFVNLVSVLHNSNACQIHCLSGDADIPCLDDVLDVVVGTADHDGADGVHPGSIKAFSLSSLETALDCLTDCDCLCAGEGNSSVDGDSAICQLFESLDAGFAGRSLDLAVGNQCSELAGLFDHEVFIAVILCIGLEGDTALLAMRLFKHRKKELGSLCAELSDDIPCDIIFCPCRVVSDHLFDGVFPIRKLFLQNVADDNRVCCRAGAAVLDRVCQLFAAAGVIPELGLREHCYHFV